MFNRNVIVAGITGLSAMACAQAQAQQLINVDFQSRTTGFDPVSQIDTEMVGAAGIGSAGDIWNHPEFANGGASSTESNLMDSTGTVTTASITVETFSDVTGWAPGANSSDAVSLMGDGLFISNAGGTATGTIAGLTPNESYTLVMYGLGDQAFRPDTAAFTVTGSNEGTLATTGNNTGPIASPDHYVTFTGSTSGSGEIAFTWTGAPGVFSAFNGFQLELGGGSPALPGDTDGDGDVDDADLGVSFANYTGPLAPNTGGKTAADGDVDGDGDVDDADLGASFAAYTGPTASAAVPEPTSLALLGLGGLLAVRRRRA
jgi:hypothetical protein